MFLSFLLNFLTPLVLAICAYVMQTKDANNRWSKVAFFTTVVFIIILGAGNTYKDFRDKEDDKRDLNGLGKTITTVLGKYIQGVQITFVRDNGKLEARLTELKQSKNKTDSVYLEALSRSEKTPNLSINTFKIQINTYKIRSIPLEDSNHFEIPIRNTGDGIAYNINWKIYLLVKGKSGDIYYAGLFSNTSYKSLASGEPIIAMPALITPYNLLEQNLFLITDISYYSKQGTKPIKLQVCYQQLSGNEWIISGNCQQERKELEKRGIKTW